MKKVLLISYYFPPMGMGGTQRAAKFVKYLPEFDWEPIVITVKDVKYYARDDTLLDEIRDRTIIRTESLDPLRLLARFGGDHVDDGKKSFPHAATGSSRLLNLVNRFFVNWFFIPDSKILWLPFAFFAALQTIKKHHLKVVYTTSPPHSAHFVGLILKWMTGVKWVADFRDDWTGGESQPSPTPVHTFFNRLLEKVVLKYADRVVAICDHLTAILKKKNGCSFQVHKFVTIPNGYDADDFQDAVNLPPHKTFTITHSGSISKVSDPEPFLKAVRAIFQEHPDLRQQIRIQFFGTDLYGRLKYLLKELELEAHVQPIRYLPHRQALKEIMQSHLLLLTIFKRTGEEIITGKIFEYLGSGKPILLISPQGEVARWIRRMNRGRVLKNNDLVGIKRTILDYVHLFQQGKLKCAEPLSVPEFDRRNVTAQLAGLFAECVDS